MKFFIDAEFWEAGPTRPIQLISLAMVSEIGTELYLVNEDFDWSKCDSEWLRKNVLPHLHDSVALVRPYAEFANTVVSWVNREAAGQALEFWGYYSDYDWVVFCQMFGSMVDLPAGFPKFCMDVKQLAVMSGVPKVPGQGDSEHCALADARWIRGAYAYIFNLLTASKVQNVVLKNGVRFQDRNGCTYEKVSGPDMAAGKLQPSYFDGSVVGAMIKVPVIDGLKIDTVVFRRVS